MGLSVGSISQATSSQTQAGGTEKKAQAVPQGVHQASGTDAPEAAKKSGEPQGEQGQAIGEIFSMQTQSYNTAVMGVTMSFAGLAGGPVTVTVFKDATNLFAQVQTFVLNYNATVAALHKAADAPGPGHSLSGSSLHVLQAELGKMATWSPTSAWGPYQTLASVGVRLLDDGTLTADATRLEHAIANNEASVASLLGHSVVGHGVVGHLGELAATLHPPTESSFKQAADGAHQIAPSLDVRSPYNAHAVALQRHYQHLEEQMTALREQNARMLAWVQSEPSQEGLGALAPQHIHPNPSTVPPAPDAQATTATDAATGTGYLSFVPSLTQG